MSQAALIRNPPPQLKNLFAILFWIIVSMAVFAIVRSCASEHENTNHTSYDVTTGARMFVPVSADTTKPVTDQNALTSQNALAEEWSRYADSVLKKTSINDFNEWLMNSVTVKQYQEGKFSEFYNAFLQQQYQIWQAKKQKK